MRIALAQINPTTGDLKGNVAKIINEINRARQNSTDLIIFPEMAEHFLDLISSPQLRSYL